MAFFNKAHNIFNSNPDPNLYHRLTQLQCPFTWNIQSGAGFDFDYFLKEEEDRVLRHAHHWSKVVAKLTVAYHYCKKGYFEKCKTLLVECYIPLLQEEMFENGCGCDLVRKHKVALRHVLDGTWAHIFSSWNSPDYLDSFIDKIIPHSSMSPQESAAVFAIRARVDQLSGKPDHALIAIRMDPTEGQWHFYLSMNMYIGLHNHHKGLLCGKLDAVKKSAYTAYKLRGSPETIIFLARVLLEDNELQKAAVLFRKAIEQYPDSLYTNLECGMVFYGSPPPVQDKKASEQCFKKALHLGPDCLQVHLAYGQYLLVCGKPQEAAVHLKKAAPVHQDAIITMQHLQNPNGPPNCETQ